MYCPEPTVEELLRDPVAHAVMRRDGLTPDDVRQVIHETKLRLGRFQPCGTAAGRLN